MVFIFNHYIATLFTWILVIILSIKSIAKAKVGKNKMKTSSYRH